MCDTNIIIVAIEVPHGAKYVLKQFPNSAKEYVGEKIGMFGKLKSHTAIPLRMCKPCGQAPAA